MIEKHWYIEPVICLKRLKTATFESSEPFYLVNGRVRVGAITNKESVADLGGGGVAIPLPLYFLALRGAI